MKDAAAQAAEYERQNQLAEKARAAFVQGVCWCACVGVCVGVCVLVCVCVGCVCVCAKSKRASMYRARLVCEAAYTSSFKVRICVCGWVPPLQYRKVSICAYTSPLRYALSFAMLRLLCAPPF